MKVCTKCKELKEYSEFYKGESYIDGYQGNCKHCLKKYRDENKESRYKLAKKWRGKNKKKLKETKREYYIKNKDIILQKSRELYIYKPRTNTKWRRENPNYNKEYRDANKNNPLFKLSDVCNSRIGLAFKRKGFKKTSNIEELLGCDLNTLKTHLENQFTKGMNWSNQGQWHIDHIIPFDSVTSKADIEKLCHYKNTQPLWARDNIAKGIKQ